MNTRLSLHTMLVLLLVAASTAVLVAPELLGASGKPTHPALLSLLAIGHA